MQLRRLLFLLVLWSQSCAAGEPAQENSPRGSLHGTIVLDGDLAGDDQDDARDDLIVDDDSRGVKNVFVYLLQSPEPKSGDHESLNDVTVQIADHQIEPRAFVVRTGQTIRFRSADNEIHNIRITPIRNSVPGYLPNPNQVDQTFCFGLAESIPLPVRCDIDAHLRGWVLIVDHPYAAVTGEAGTFKIDNIPAGEHKIRVWHERVGYLEKSLTVKIQADKPTHLGELKYSADRFKEKP